MQPRARWATRGMHALQATAAALAQGMLAGKRPGARLHGAAADVDEVSAAALLAHELLPEQLRAVGRDGQLQHAAHLPKSYLL